MKHQRGFPGRAQFAPLGAVDIGVENEAALIEEFVRRKYRLAPREGLFQEEKDLASAYRRLARAGFRTGEIVRVLKRFAKNPELLDNFEPPEEPLEE